MFIRSSSNLFQKLFSQSITTGSRSSSSSLPNGGFLLYTCAIATTAMVSSYLANEDPTLVFCEAPVAEQPKVMDENNKATSTDKESAAASALLKKEKSVFNVHDYILKPKKPYPLWYDNWDGREPTEVLLQRRDSIQRRELKRKIRKEGVTRHIILVRHGQYHHRDKPEDRVLTKLGREQAELTGQRLAEMVKGFDEKLFNPCDVKVLRVSNVIRAKETADIIAKYLPADVEVADPDPDLDEGWPALPIPRSPPSKSTLKALEQEAPRIERAFQRYFYRAHFDLDGTKNEEVSHNAEEDEEDNDDDGKESDYDIKKEEEEEKLKKKLQNPKHEFEIIVCHGNVIRFFFMRALQLPPEAWLRLCTFNCSINYFVVRPTGSVSCRTMGDIGHLGYDHSTFSMHHGFNW